MVASAHNVANLTTSAFRPLRVTQESLAEGGSLARLEREQHAQEVDLVREILEQSRATLQYRASVAFLARASETHGSLVDLLA